MHAGMCKRWPRRICTNLLYKAHAHITAPTLMVAGYLNWLGEERIIVEVYEHISNTFCQLASTAEKAPRFSASTSCVSGLLMRITPD